MYAIFFALFCVLTAACAPRYADFFPYYDNGTKKPSVSLFSVYNDTEIPFAGNFPVELSKGVRNRMKRAGKIYCPPIAQTQKEMGAATVKELTTTADLKLFSRFRGTDFAVCMELVECKVVPYKRGAFKPIYLANIDEDDAKVVSIATRLKIVNLKGKEPKLARMELVKSNHMISNEELKSAEKGNRGALELVRSRLARDLAQKIEETVCVKQ